MAEDLRTPAPDQDAEIGSTERLADPDDYNLRRRLKQLHNAKEAVVETKDAALDQFDTRDSRDRAETDRAVAEKLVDYIHELRPVMQNAGIEDQFLDEEIGEVEGAEVTIGDIIDTRGSLNSDSDSGRSTAWIPYETSMAAWDVCNRYFEMVAGATFEKRTAPEDNLVDPANRFER